MLSICVRNSAACSECQLTNWGALRLATGSNKRRVLFFPQWVDFDLECGVVDYAREAGWYLTGLAHHGADLQVARATMLPADGMIVLTRHRDLAEYVESQDLPVVDVADTMRSLDVHRVLMDDEAIGRMAAEHLVEQGLQSLAFLPVLESGQTDDRQRGVADVAAAAGCPAGPPNAGRGL